MKKLCKEYWEKFITTDKAGNQIGNGIEFENLVGCLLAAIYGIEWIPTLKSHDDNRDFWIYLNEKHLWAECKNYQKSIAMSTIAPTLVMAQIYEVNQILFFSRSDINPNAKNKIMAFGEKSNKIILFYDGQRLEELIYSYRNQLPAKYSPLSYLKTISTKLLLDNYIHIYFSQDSICNVKKVDNNFRDYTGADVIYYNKTFALSFYLLNPFTEDNVEVYIEFQNEDEDRFCFEYLYPTLMSEKKKWYSAELKRGEGRAVSLNMRQIKYKSKIYLPQFHIIFINKKGEKLEWNSKPVAVKCHWVGTTPLVGSNYYRILEEVKNTLLNKPNLSGLIFSGSSGTGKSRMIEECQNIFLSKGYQLINFSGQKEFSSHYFLKELICFLYEIPTEDILDVLEERLTTSETNIVFGENTEFEKAMSLLKVIIKNRTEDSLKEVIDKYGDIIFEKLAKNKNVLIIDNMQYAEEAFFYFIEQYIYYSVNKQMFNYSVFLLVFNLDYMTYASSELLYNIIHANIKYLLSYKLEGFKEKEQGILYLQELTRTRKDENADYFSEIIDKVSLNPYNLYQTVKYLEEANVICISPEKRGYITSNLNKYRVLSEISDGIADVLKRRMLFISNQVSIERILYICSIVYLFETIDKSVQNIFEIQSDELKYLSEKKILKTDTTNLLQFDHDIIRNFFLQTYSEHVFDCLEWLKLQDASEKVRKYRMVYFLYEIVILKNYRKVIDICQEIHNIYVPERIASVFYNQLLNAFSEMLEKNIYQGIYIKYIHELCAYIRQYDGSEKAWHVTKEMYDTIQVYYPNALSEDILYYRPFIHFCCDIAVESHFYQEEIGFIKDVITSCKKTNPINIENQDEIYVLEAIMYNRWYLAYNTESYKTEVQVKRASLMEKSREYISKITNPQKKGLIEYLNFSDEGYNFYGYQKDKEKLFEIWNHCIIDIPSLVPEKTLNYYRKKVQYGLIAQNEETVRKDIANAFEYLENGKYAHEPIIFRTFFLMAEIMCNIQHSPEKTYEYNFRTINNILEMQQLLNNHKLGDILLLKGVNACYAQNMDETYYAYKEAWKCYESASTSRYWIKKALLEENIHYSFTCLGIYKAGYDVSFLPMEYRQPLVLSGENSFIASGIQRTGDLHLNLPLI